MAKRPLASTKAYEDYVGYQRGTGAAQRNRKTGPPFIKINRTVRYDLDEVDKWLAERTVRHNEPAPAPQPTPKPATDLPAWLQPLGAIMTRDQSNITGANQ